MSQARKAFTVIELLVVIAIIAILAAIIFPVYSRAKASSYRSSDISAMNQLRSAVLLYKEDQGGFPPALLGYASYYTSGPQMGQVIPANTVKSYLYPKRVSAFTAFKPSWNRVGDSLVTNAVYPPRDNRAVGSAPQVDLNGDGILDAMDDPANARQYFGRAANDVQNYGPDERVCPNGLIVSTGCTAAEYYTASGYDVATVKGSAYPQLRYALFWTEMGLTTGGANDDPRQLGYSDPPENTLITWNSFFREYDAQNPPQPKVGRADIAIFVGGSARPFDSVALNNQSWRVLP